MSEKENAVVAAESQKPVAWGDEEFDDADEQGQQPEDDETVKTVVEYITKDGKKVKVTKKIRTYRVTRTINKRAEARKKRWVKFGDAKGKSGIEPGVTAVADAVEIVWTKEQKKDKLLEEQLKKQIMDAAFKRNAPTWAQRRAAAAAGKPIGEGDAGIFSDEKPAASSDPNRYVPPNQRRGGLPGRPDDTSTIRVTSLSEETTEGDLLALFRPFGPISRIFLAKDKVTGESKGFAFINFINRDDAERAMNQLQGTGFDYLILNIEWAKPSNK